jgi:hypothetical protein
MSLGVTLAELEAQLTSAGEVGTVTNRRLLEP